MMLKKFALPLLCGTLFGLAACSSEEDNPSSAQQNPSGISSAAPVYSSPSTTVPEQNVSAPSTMPEQSSASPTGNTGAATTAPATGTYSALAPTSDPMAPINLYQAWKPFHFTTLEYEGASVYPSLNKDYAYVFLPEYLPAGRVVWASQTGYYKEHCKVDDAAVSTMKFRGCTVSEGIGYGMLLANFHNDDDAFTRLWNYSRAVRAYEKVNLTPWITYSFHYDIIDNSSATDADIDIATSLILMYYKKQDVSYLNDALTIITAIWDEEVEPTTKLLLSGNTSMWTGQMGKEIVYNLSYFSPVALRLFAMVDASHDWKAVLDAMYAYMIAVQNAGTGVFPDWSNAQGVAANPPNGDGAKTYWTFNKESVRIPWRIAWDYYWFQEERAATVLNTLNKFISTKAGGDPNSTALATNYSWNLSAGADITNGAVSNGWYAAWCATGIAGNAEWLKKCTTGLNSRSLTNSGSSYFHDILLVMYSQLLNGLFVKSF